MLENCIKNCSSPSVLKLCSSYLLHNSYLVSMLSLMCRSWFLFSVEFVNSINLSKVSNEDVSLLSLSDS